MAQKGIILNIYVELNQLIEYIENNLENDIDYSVLKKMVCTSEYTMKRMFVLLTNVTLSEYIRNRRLSNAGFDLCNGKEKIIDIALKYKYENATSFSRAFEKFHGIKPSIAKNNPDKLKVFTRLKFNENINQNQSIEYSIVEMDKKILYGKGVKTTYNTIHTDAPKFFSDFNNKYFHKYGEPNYGLVMYEDRFESNKFEYWVAYSQKINEFQKIVIPKSKWILFKIDSQDPKEIQKVSRDFYEKFLPSSKFALKPLPELEYYHDDVTDFYVPIED